MQEYSRELVSVHPLESVIPLSDTSADIAPSTPPPIPALATIASTNPPVETHTYIWINPLQELKPDIWEFAEFVRTNAWKWVGNGEAAQQNQDYLEVDKRREMGGVIVRREIVDGTEQDEGRKVVIEVDTKECE